MIPVNVNTWSGSVVTPLPAGMLQCSMKMLNPSVTILGDARATMIVYKITNTATGRSYIGISTRSLGHRIREHVYEALTYGTITPLYRSMRSRGLGVFTAETLEQHDTIEALNEAEIRLIAQYGTFKTGYNQTAGGGGNRGVESPWTVERNRSKRKLTEEDIRAILLDTRPAVALGAEYGVQQSTISSICRGRIYKDLYEKVCATLPPEVVERNLKFRSNPRPHKRGDLHHMRDPERARRHSEKLRGKPVPHTSARNIANRSLTEDDIRLILADKRPVQQIAAEFGKSATLIRNIRSGKKYADVVQKIRAESQ